MGYSDHDEEESYTAGPKLIEFVKHEARARYCNDAEFYNHCNLVGELIGLGQEPFSEQTKDNLEIVVFALEADRQLKATTNGQPMTSWQTLEFNNEE